MVDKSKKKPAPLTKRLAAVASPAVDDKPVAMKVRTKFVVMDKREEPVVGPHQELVARYHVKLAAAYEAKPIHGGLATVQGNADNKIFGLREPDAVIGMIIESKAIADTFGIGRSFAVDFTEVVEG